MGDVEVKGEVVGEGKGEVVGEGEVESVADMSRLGSEPSELLTVMMVGRGLLPTLAGPEAWTGGAGGASPGGGLDVVDVVVDVGRGGGEGGVPDEQAVGGQGPHLDQIR